MIIKKSAPVRGEKTERPLATADHFVIEDAAGTRWRISDESGGLGLMMVQDGMGRMSRLSLVCQSGNTIELKPEHRS